MERIVRVERRQRGFLGWLFLILFWGFNALMCWALVAGVAAVAEGPQAVSEAEKAGQAIGTALGMGMILSIWALGAVVLGIIVLLTRGSKTIIETREK